MADIIVFDGVCHLCSRWVQFLLKHDRKKLFQFAPMQGETGKRLLQQGGLNPDDPVSFLYSQDGQLYTDTEAIICVLCRLGGIWKLAGAGYALPRFARDPLYRVVARNRYRWFGRRETCMLPGDAETASRFLP